MLEPILLICLIVLVIVVISATRRSRELTRVNTQIAKQTLKQTKASPLPPQQPQTQRYAALAKIKALLDDGVLTAAEFETEKQRILGETVSAIEPPTKPDTLELNETTAMQEMGKHGYRVKKKNDSKWRIDEPLGGTKFCHSLDELLDYAQGVVNR